MSRSPISKQLRYRILERDGFACRYCGAKNVRLQIDHRMPVSRGGTNDFFNLITACEPCNNGKGAALPAWLVPAQRNFAVGAWLFQQAGERFGRDMPMWEAFNIIVDFALMLENPDPLREILFSSESWEDLRRAMYDYAGYPPFDAPEDEE